MTVECLSCDHEVLYTSDPCSTAGSINYVDVLKNSDGRSRGCAAVVFETEDAAEKAISES